MWAVTHLGFGLGPRHHSPLDSVQKHAGKYSDFSIYILHSSLETGAVCEIKWNTYRFPVRWLWTARLSLSRILRGGNTAIRNTTRAPLMTGYISPAHAELKERRCHRANIFQLQLIYHYQVGRSSICFWSFTMRRKIFTKKNILWKFKLYVLI